MSDWFVDSAAAGDGSGSSPTNAAICVTSLYARVGSGPVAGDNVWVRRTYVEEIPVNVAAVPWGSNSGQTTSNSAAVFNYCIGWPNSADHFFDLRPTSARSGSTPDWDNDPSSPYPIVVSSHSVSNRGISPRAAFGIFNFMSVNSQAMQSLWVHGDAGANANWEQGNLFNYGRAGGWVTGGGSFISNVTDYTITTSGTVIFSAVMYNAGKITVTASSVLGGFLNSIFSGEVQHIHNESNSVDAIFAYVSGTLGNYFLPARIRKMSGVKPLRPIIQITTDFNDANLRCYIDDYYGEGSRVAAPPGGISLYRTTSAQANYVGRETYCSEVNSGGSTLIYGQGKAHQHVPDATAWIRVNSGTPVSIAWPIYGVDAANPEINFGKLMFLCSVFSGQVSNPIIVGSRYLKVGNVGSWSGNSVSGGSAYFMVHTVTPRETGTIPVQLYVPGFNARSGYWLYPVQPDIT